MPDTFLMDQLLKDQRRYLELDEQARVAAQRDLSSVNRVEPGYRYQVEYISVRR